MVQTGDKIIIMAYAELEDEEVAAHKPKVVFLEDDNKIGQVTTYEKHGAYGAVLEV